MSLTVYENLEQGTEEWLKARCGVLTASVIGQLVTPKTMKLANNETSRALVRTLAAERITSWVEPTFPSRDMERGNWDEPIARDIYETATGNDVQQVGFMTRTFADYEIGYSPDGLVGDDGLIEIKSRRQKTQLDTILTNTVPAMNMAQLQAGLLVSGREWCDYISFCGGMPLFIKRVYPDKRWQSLLMDAADNFELDVHQLIRAFEKSAVNLIPTDRPAHYYPDEDMVI